MEALLLALVLLVPVALFVLGPLRRPRAAGTSADPGLADLEARKEAKYREIADARGDHVAGKLSDEDFAAVDAELRAEALEILDRLAAARR